MKSIASIAFGVAVAGLVAAAAQPADALDNGKQLLSGGASIAVGSTVFLAPGVASVYGPNFPKTGQGELAAQIRMQDGILSLLRVSVRTENVPAGGTMTVMVRINQTDTTLNCQVTAAGFCQTAVNVSEVITSSQRLAIRVVNTLVNPGFATVSYTLVYD